MNNHRVYRVFLFVTNTMKTETGKQTKPAITPTAKPITKPTKAQEYRAFVADKGLNTVDVPGKSGAIYKMRKPGAVQMLFNGEMEKLLRLERDQSDEAQIEKVLYLRDKVIELSEFPKIVIGQAESSKGEKSAADVPGEDLMVLLAWAGAALITIHN
jgi:hypothetical protein